ncbi:MAG: S-layer homology domain-containing protein, partial [Clostridiales Family XIII bacterium]|nr:S-layer homology domain-containing protein [Clostridiales Family XIII bacterium]
MRKKIQMSLATAAILLVAAIFPVQALALEVPQGQTDVRIPVTVSTSGTVAGVEIGFSYTNDGLSFVRFEPSAAVSGAQQISAERYGTTWVGFYSDTNAYGSAAGGQLDMGSLVFDYTGDAANTVSLTNCTVYTVNAANEVVSDDRDWSGEVTVTRASAASSGTGTGTGTGTGSTSTGANSFNISEGDTPLTTTKVTFSDLGGAEWAREAIEYLANNKGILGLGDGLFAPNAEVTRAQFSRFMSQAFGITKGAEPSSFTDVVSGSWYYDDVTL